MTLWRKPENGDVLRYKHGGALTNITHGHLFTQEWVQQYGRDYEFVAVTLIEPPPQPLRQTVYAAMFNHDGKVYASIVSGPSGSMRLFANSGEEAKQRTAGFVHRIGIIKVELVEGQYDD